MPKTLKEIKEERWDALVERLGLQEQQCLLWNMKEDTRIIPKKENIWPEEFR